ncbi:MAG: DUF72 domain-containing protein [bacterium]
MARFYIGTIGWDYQDWAGVFYPLRMAKDKRLAFTASQMNTLEVDSSAYHLPTPATVGKWATEAPPHFRFSIKLPQTITHMARLKNCQDAVNTYCQTIAPFGDKLGSSCIQLPPNFTAKKSLGDLERFLTWLPSTFPWAIELRHPSWLEPSIRDLLTAHKVAWVNSDRQPEFIVTGPTAYVRLLGEYGQFTRVDRLQIDKQDELDALARTLAKLPKKVKTIYGYCGKYFEGHSPATMRRLRESLVRVGVAPANCGIPPSDPS